jgi:hypothetical protein
VRTFGSDALNFEVRGVVSGVHAELVRLIADFNGNAAPLDAESFDVAVHDRLLAARAAAACKREDVSSVMPSA